MDKEGNCVQRALFENHRNACHVNAYVAYKQRYAGEYGVVNVIAVAHDHAVLAVVLQQKRNGYESKIFVLLFARLVL